MYGQVFFVSLTLLTSLVTAVVYGLGGILVIDGAFQIGTLVALTRCSPGSTARSRRCPTCRST